MAISIGTKAPDFNLKSKQASGLVDVKLSNNTGKKNTVLLFFPLAFTGVCTQEMCDVTASLNGYSGLNADIIGISVDSPFSQEAWAQREKIGRSSFPHPRLCRVNKLMTRRKPSLFNGMRRIGW